MRYDLIGTLLTASLLAIVLPVVLAWALRRRFKVRLVIFAVGAGAFVVSQIVHMPLLWGSTAAFAHHVLPQPPRSWWWFNPVFLGLAAGLCEEPARWLALRFVLKKHRSREDALMFGAGHGGIESILLVGLAVPLGLVNMIAMHDMSAAELAAFAHIDAHTAEQAIAQVRQYWQTAWWQPFLAVFERGVAITLHVALSALVALGVRRGSIWPLFLAIFVHALVDGVAVVGAGAWNPVTVELVLFALIVPASVLILVMTWRASPPATEAPVVAEATARTR